MSQRVITFHYTLSDPQGETIDSSQGHEPLSFLEGQGEIIPGLERHLQGMKAQEKAKVTIPAAEAYGARDENFVVTVPLDKLPAKDVKVGDQFRADGTPEGLPFTVVQMTATEATLDGNHPLAGVDLTFDVELVSIREATAEETTHGHVHGPGGHHH